MNQGRYFAARNIGAYLQTFGHSTALSQLGSKEISAKSLQKIRSVAERFDDSGFLIHFQWAVDSRTDF
jgi:uncharacterized protein (UPF0276 family)